MRMSERMANNKNPKPSTEDAMAAVSALIAKAKREGSIQSSELTAELEKLDLPVEKIEHIYDTFDAMVSARSGCAQCMILRMRTWDMIFVITKKSCPNLGQWRILIRFCGKCTSGTSSW